MYSGLLCWRSLGLHFWSSIVYWKICWRCILISCILGSYNDIWIWLAWHFQLTIGLWTLHKMRLGWSKKSDFSSGCKALRTHFLPLDQPKFYFDVFEKAMIPFVESHFEVIFCFLTNRNCDFFQINKATNQVIEWLSKAIFCLLTSPKFDFREFEKTMFQ